MHIWGSTSTITIYEDDTIVKRTEMWLIWKLNCGVCGTSKFNETIHVWNSIPFWEPTAEF
ncbi:MAG: hypothetical protein ACKESB_02815 [Candidatus Hodgkinia cicadicola]